MEKSAFLSVEKIVNFINKLLTIPLMKTAHLTNEVKNRS